MPLNKKGKKIMKAMKTTYGKDAKAVFYASKNKGTIKNVEKKIDEQISESVKNSLEAPEPPSKELTKYIWAED